MGEKIIAVIGAGTIGTDVALDLAINNFSVVLKDLSDDMLKKATERLKNNYRFTKLMKKAKSLPLFDEIMQRIKLTTDYNDFSEVNMVIENITEDFEAKKKLYLELRDVCRENTIYGVNTSCISITKIGALLPNPDKVIGMHFMNPVPLSELVEVVVGFHTTDETVDKVKRFIKNLHKTCVVVNDLPGFVTNRVLMLTINECIWLVHDQVAGPREIDMIFKLGFGHKMGPLATADLIGLDTILDSLSVLYENYNDTKYRPCPLLRKMVDAGLLGKKCERGFFKY
jgi:3-hydroxybutyryl-CoA dehydrogenase